MQIKRVKGKDNNFFYLCQELEKYQFCLLPNLANTNYSLTNDLDKVVGYLMLENKKPVACIGIKKIDDEKCELVRAFVVEEFRKNGYATYLFEKISSMAKSLGYKSIELVVWCKATQAINFYNKLGFLKKDEKFSEFYGGYKYLEMYKEID